MMCVCSVFVCVRACMHPCVCSMCVHPYVCCVCVVYVYVCAHTYACIHEQHCMYIDDTVYVWVCMHACVCVHVHTQCIITIILCRVACM